MKNLTKEKVQELLNTELAKYSEFGKDIHLYVSHDSENSFTIQGGVRPYLGISHLGTCYVYEIFKKINLQGMVVNVFEGNPIVSFEKSLRESILWIKKQMKECNISYKKEFGKNFYPLKYIK